MRRVRAVGCVAVALIVLAGGPSSASELLWEQALIPLPTEFLVASQDFEPAYSGYACGRSQPARPHSTGAMGVEGAQGAERT